MSKQTSTRDHDHDHLHHEVAAVAPGKQTLTQGIPSLRGRERDIASFGETTEWREPRATIDAPPTTLRLTDRQLRKARRRNPHWHQRLGFSPADFGGGALASNELAENIAERQAALGLAVDGIAGPKTIAALAAAAPAGGDRAAHGGPASPAQGRDHDLDALFERTIAEAGAASEDDADDDHDLDALFDRTIAEASGDSPGGGGSGGGGARGGGGASRIPPVLDDPFGMHLLGQRR